MRTDTRAARAGLVIDESCRHCEVGDLKPNSSPARSLELERIGSEPDMCTVRDTDMKPATPLRVFQPTANQRLSCRKITCKAFPFVVEEHRSRYLWLAVELRAARPEDFPLRAAGVTWWRRISEDRGSPPEPESKSVGCLLLWKRFIKGLRQFGKNFFRIRKELLPNKETKGASPSPAAVGEHEASGRRPEVRGGASAPRRFSRSPLFAALPLKCQRGSNTRRDG
ncbi:Arginine-glutamic acid dipeptide repeats protein [Liparis tanakae]|uniref:Arginine-glutamic acid dipeptide repeats protein n=1 Tax=Liparis tanakae TaxID=230148 RepID=A0A4Z2IYB3_9TELE|nr:Arginine-glutamic acid dipeptide repeats protein [Liparis tanakae]